MEAGGRGRSNDARPNDDDYGLLRARGGFHASDDLFVVLLVLALGGGGMGRNPHYVSLELVTCRHHVGVGIILLLTATCISLEKLCGSRDQTVALVPGSR